jgi:hypothetical protein
MAYDNEGNYFDEGGMGPNPEFMVQPDRVYSEPTAPPPPMLINPDFAVMPEPRRSDTAEDYAAWRALYPDARSDFWGDKPPSPPPPQLDPNYNPYAPVQPYNPYDTQPKPYDPYNLDRNDKPTVYPYDTQPLPYNLQPYNPYDTQPKPYQPYETLPQPDNPYETQLQPYPYEAVRDGGVTYPYDPSTNTYPTAPPGYNPYDTQPKPYNPEQNDKPTVYPYGTQPTASPMNIGQILAGIGYGNSSQPAPTMAPMVSGMFGAGAGMPRSNQPAPTMTPMASGMAGAAGIGSDLASLLRRYYGK